ncbi:MAG: hypothetical protein H6Q20_1105 [Bacteroidetes bacterium]|nr:hypothetical protein [Bacteroidota bacterium]
MFFLLLNKKNNIGISSVNLSEKSWLKNKVLSVFYTC